MKNVMKATTLESKFPIMSVEKDCIISKDADITVAAPIGALLTCNHIVNQYIFIDDSAEMLRKFEQTARNMHSLSRYSRSNQINREWIEEYLNEAHSFGLTAVRAHCNVFAWSDDKERLKRVKNDVGSQLAMMEAKPRHNTVDVPTLFWAAIPGNAGDFPSEESFYTFIEQALCLFIEETTSHDSLSPFGIRMVDRLTGKPIHLDISDLPMKKGIITNRNKFILGPSGSGKSFFTNHMVRQYYEQGTHILLVDTGNSYQGLCSLINARTHGKDGIYLTYDENDPIAFNPFYVEDGVFDIEKKESIKTLILTLWKRDDEPDGEGTLRMDDGMVLLPNDRYPLDREVFRIYYTSECDDQQTIDVYFEDNHDQLYQLTFTFDNKIENEGNVNNEGADVTDENDGDSNGNDDNNADDTGNDNGDDDSGDDGSTLIPSNDEVYRVVNP